MVGQEREPINAVVSKRCYHNQLLYEGSVFPITLLYSAPLLEWNWNLTVDHFFQQWSVHWDDPWSHQLSICHHHYQSLHKNVHWAFRLQAGDQWFNTWSFSKRTIFDCFLFLLGRRGFILLQNSPWCFVFTEASTQKVFIALRFKDVILLRCFLNASQESCVGFLLCSLNRRFRYEISRCILGVIHGNWSPLTCFLFSGACSSNTLLYSLVQYVWYDMIWYWMVWYGVIWCGVVWYGIVWHGTVHRRNPTGVRHRYAQRCDSENKHSAVTAKTSTSLWQRWCE